MPDTTTKILVLTILLLFTALLIGNRLGLHWAGGDGMQHDAVISNGESVGNDCDLTNTDTLHTHITTCSGQTRRFDFAQASFALAETSDISIINANTDDAVVSLVTGRVVIEGDTTVSVRDVKITTHGTVTLVHYSWLNTIDLKVISGSAEVRQGAYSTTVTEDNAVSIDTLPPYQAITPTIFNLDAASVQAFYDWALQ